MVLGFFVLAWTALVAMVCRKPYCRHRDLQIAIVALPLPAQRALAEWVTRVSLAEAGMDSDPTVVAVTSPVRWVRDTGSAARSGSTRQRLERLQDQWSRKAMESEDSGGLERTYVSQHRWA